MRNRFIHCFTGRRSSISHLVLHPELVPLEPAHLMKRQHIDALDISQANRKLGNAIHLFHVVSPAWHDDEANPDWMFSRSKSTREFMNRFVIHAGEALVQSGFYRLESKHHKIDRRKIIIGEARA